MDRVVPSRVENRRLILSDTDAKLISTFVDLVNQVLIEEQQKFQITRQQAHDILESFRIYIEHFIGTKNASPLETTLKHLKIAIARNSEVAHLADHLAQTIQTRAQEYFKDTSGSRPTLARATELEVPSQAARSAVVVVVNKHIALDKTTVGFPNTPAANPVGFDQTVPAAGAHTQTLELPPGLIYAKREDGTGLLPGDFIVTSPGYTENLARQQAATAPKAAAKTLPSAAYTDVTPTTSPSLPSPWRQPRLAENTVAPEQSAPTIQKDTKGRVVLLIAAVSVVAAGALAKTILDHRSKPGSPTPDQTPITAPASSHKV